jgi:hypothetical protein
MELGFCDKLQVLRVQEHMGIHGGVKSRISSDIMMNDPSSGTLFCCEDLF